jgi:2-dehydropantoate 2-reductase
MHVGTTLGYQLEPIFGLSAEDFLGSTDEVLKKNLMALISHIGKESLNCILQDHMKGRRSEVELLNGLVVRKGKEAKVPTPLNEAIAYLDKQIEQGILKPDRSNLKILEKLATSIPSWTAFSSPPLHKEKYHEGNTKEVISDEGLNQ